MTGARAGGQAHGVEVVAGRDRAVDALRKEHQEVRNEVDVHKELVDVPRDKQDPRVSRVLLRRRRRGPRSRGSGRRGGRARVEREQE